MPCEELRKCVEGLIFEVVGDYAAVNHIPDHVLAGFVSKIVIGEDVFFAVNESDNVVSGFELLRHADTDRAEIPVSEDLRKQLAEVLNHTAKVLGYFGIE